MHIKKNGAVISVIVLLLCVAVYLNWSYSRSAGEDAAVNGDQTGLQDPAEPASDQDRFEQGQWVIDLAQEGGTEASGDVSDARLDELGAYFDETRLERQTSRDQELSLLKETLEKADITEEAKASAEAQIAAIAANSVTESRIESLVTAKGFLECVAMISDAGVSVVVLPEVAGLQASDVAKIKDIVIQETSVSADMIRIIESQ